jgi:hypothetical protein
MDGSAGGAAREKKFTISKTNMKPHLSSLANSKQTGHGQALSIHLAIQRFKRESQ